MQVNDVYPWIVGKSGVFSCQVHYCLLIFRVFSIFKDLENVDGEDMEKTELENV